MFWKKVGKVNGMKMESYRKINYRNERLALEEDEV